MSVRALALDAQRRQDTSAQRAMAAAKMANIKWGSNQHAQKVEMSAGVSTQPTQTRTREEAAKLAGVGRSSVDRALTGTETVQQQMADKRP